ncbi:MAG: proline--tRNA ligase, partial [Nanoarchaeota archaeon]
KTIIKEYRGFIKAPWCSTQNAGDPCMDVMKAETEGGEVCGTLWPKEDTVPKGSVCAVCGKPAKHIVYIAKSY